MKKNYLLVLSSILLCSCNININTSSSYNNNSNDNLSSCESINVSSDLNSISDNESSSKDLESSDELLSSTSSDNSSESINLSPYQRIEKYSDLNQNYFYENFFNYSSDIKISLKFTNEVIYKLAKYSSDSNKSDMYHPCDMEIVMNDITYFFPEVGVRMKGNTSKNPNFVDENGNLNAQIHFKISVNQTFDSEEDNDYYIKTYSSTEERNNRKKRRIGDAKKFDLKYNKNEDNTFTKQIYAYNCFEDIGLPVLKNNLVKVNVNTANDSYSYNYELQECIDDEFISKRFDDESSLGNLYKSCYTSSGPADLTYDSINRIGIETSSYSPSYDLKTNKKSADHSLLTNLITVLNNDKSDSLTFKQTLDNLVDIDSLLKFEAISWVLGNPDDMRNNYNNYYIYFESKTNKAIFIPYDYDRCLGILKDWPIDLSNTPCYTTKQNLGNRIWQKNPLLWRTILVAPEGQDVEYASNYPVIEEYRNRYMELCKEYAAKYLDVNRFKEFNNQFVYSNKDIENGGSNNMSFETYATNKLKTFEE